MDKKNTIIGAVLLVAAFAVFKFAPTSAPPSKASNAQVATAPATPATASSNPAEAPAASAPAAPSAVNRDAANAQVTVLANDFIEARFTNFGGAVRDVAFKKYANTQGKPDPYVFNHLHEDPILALGGYPGTGRDTAYEVVRSSPSEVVYRTVVEGKLEVTRTYHLAGNGPEGPDPYRILHETTVRNLTGASLPLPRVTLSLGTTMLLNDRDTGQYLSVLDFDGSDANFTARGDFDGGGFGSIIGQGRPAREVIETNRSVVWAAVKNQFFTSVYTPEKPGVGLIAKKLDLSREAPFADPRRPNIELTAAARFELPALAANESTKLTGSLYVGPQEYKRLKLLPHDEDRVLPYTQYFFNRIFFSRFVAPLENELLNFSHKFVGNWGVAVIVMTLILKVISLPFTLAASRSAKRMAKLQPELQAMREKYKDNPQKLQMATMELFKTHKVNPVGGCIPVLITMPLFIGFFAMLQSAAELRFQPFLWAPDLAAPDTVATIWGLPINIMPLLMGATMIFQMRLTPQPSVDKAQATMMKFMPIIFTLFCYGFSCALALYSTINGIFTIGQQLVINRMKDDPGPVGPGTAAATTLGGFGKRVKNVTPKKK